MTKVWQEPAVRHNLSASSGTAAGAFTPAAPGHTLF
jgi:hypothetical protein